MFIFNEIFILKMLFYIQHKWNIKILRYRRIVVCFKKEKPSRDDLDGGGAKGSRTPDLLNAIQTRYQLRYNPDACCLVEAEGLEPPTSCM